MRPVEIGIATYLVLCFGDRLRQIDWWTVKPRFVALYLSHMLWALSLLYDTTAGELQLHQTIGLVAMLVLIRVTKVNWVNGVPNGFRVGQEHARQPDL